MHQSYMTTARARAPWKKERAENLGEEDANSRVDAAGEERSKAAKEKENPIALPLQRPQACSQ